MGKYSIKDFKKGDQVHHLSNKSLKMVVIGLDNDIAEITCRWLDKSGNMQVLGFMPEELGKESDLFNGIVVGSMVRKNHY